MAGGPRALAAFGLALLLAGCGVRLIPPAQTPVPTPVPVPTPPPPPTAALAGVRAGPAIASDAIGPDKVRCVMLPSEYTSQDSLDDAADCAGRLTINVDHIAISQAEGKFIIFTEYSAIYRN